MNWRSDLVTDMARVVFSTPGIEIARGPIAMMHGVADRYNKQAPQYNHRVEPIEVSKPKIKKRGVV